MGEIQICKRCIMDSTVPFIEFDHNGICNYCKIHDSLEKQYPLGEEGRKSLERIVTKIKNDGVGKKYDCVLGVSGGTDSTYALYLAKKLGLRPLAVHYDNGWDTETGIHNIENSTKKLGVDLFTYVEKWDEIKDFQKSFFKASTPDIEVLTDIRIKYVLYAVAAKQGVKYIINGSSFRTEGKIPPLWSYGDSTYLQSIQKRFGSKKLKTVRTLNMIENVYFTFLKGIKVIQILNYVEYSKDAAGKELAKEVDWKDYGGHHYESTITRFCYGYLLPVKFRIDKRRTHFSARMRSGLMTREEALEKIKQIPLSKEKAEEDMKYIMKKLDFSEEEFRAILSSAPKTFMDYPNNFNIVYTFRKPIILFYKSFLGTVPYTLTLMEHAKN